MFSCVWRAKIQKIEVIGRDPAKFRTLEKILVEISDQKNVFFQKNFLLVFSSFFMKYTF